MAGATRLGSGLGQKRPLHKEIGNDQFGRIKVPANFVSSLLGVGETTRADAGRHDYRSLYAPAASPAASARKNNFK